MGPIKIMLIEDHAILREGLKKLIELEKGMQVSAEAGSCKEALEKVEKNIEIVLLDIKLPDGDGLELCEPLKKVNPNIKLIALSTYDDAFFIRKALEHGVHGFIPKYASFDEIKSAISITHRDGRYLYPGLGLEVLMNLPDSYLTDLEIIILQEIAGGTPQKNIAADNFMSLSTLRRKLKGICTKLSVETTEEAIASATKKGLIK